MFTKSSEKQNEQLTSNPCQGYLLGNSRDRKKVKIISIPNTLYLVFPASADIKGSQ